MEQETLNVLTLVVAGAGLLMAIVSLAWQAWTWVQTGARVKASFFSSSLISAMENEATYTIAVSNVGRAPAQITGYAMLAPSGTGLWQKARPEFPRIPATVDGQHRQQFLWVAGPIDEELAKAGHLYPFVTLGNGRQVFPPEMLVWRDGEPRVESRPRAHRWLHRTL